MTESRSRKVKMKNRIRFEKVNYDNFDDLIGLQVKEDQKKYVASNVSSLARAYAALASGGTALPFGIYYGDKPVGFLMIGYFAEMDDVRVIWNGDEEEITDFMPGSYLIWLLMIDKDHQGKGYGKEALRLALEFIKTKPCGNAAYCWLSYEQENNVARELYRSFGFEEKEIPKGWNEAPAVLKL